jgi:hypothetical protein
LLAWKFDTYLEESGAYFAQRMRMPRSLIITELRRFCAREEEGVGEGKLHLGSDTVKEGDGSVSGMTDARHE